MGALFPGTSHIFGAHLLYVILSGAEESCCLRTSSPPQRRFANRPSPRPPFRCPRACGNPSPFLEPNAIPSPSRNLAAITAPLHVLAHAGTHPLPSPALSPAEAVREPPVPAPPLPLSSRMRGPIPSPPFPTQTSFRAQRIRAEKSRRWVTHSSPTYVFPAGASLVGARLVFSRHSSHPLSVSSRMRGPIPSS